MAHDVFISYSSSDKNAALAVLHGLEEAGIRCWMAPRDIKSGAIWAQAIMEGIEGARVLVVVFSASANRSSNVINEVDAAVRKGATIIPLRIEDAMPEGAMEYHLRTRHWLDALTPPVAAHTARLAEQVRAVLGSDVGDRPEPPSAHRDKPKDVRLRRKVSALVGEGWRRRGALLGIALAVLAGAVFLLTRERRVTDIAFTVREVSSQGGNELTLRLRSAGLRFFEAGSSIPALNQRRYDTRFAGSSRFIDVEVKLVYEAPGREVGIPMACDLFARGDQVYATISINARIQPTWTESYHAQGWGSSRGGSWPAGRYRVECKYGGRLIGRDWFEIVSGGAPPEPSPPPASPTPAPSPPPSSGVAGPLAAIGARVTSIRFFESGYGTTPAGERDYQEVFSAQASRFINVELTLEHEAPARTVSVTVTCRYLRNRSEEIGRARIPFRVNPETTSIRNTGGWGGRNPGTWQSGVYQVVCDDGRSRLGAGEFLVR